MCVCVRALYFFLTLNTKLADSYSKTKCCKYKLKHTKNIPYAQPALLNNKLIQYPTNEQLSATNVRHDVVNETEIENVSEKK